MKPKLIGFAGPGGSGKSHATRFLASRFPMLFRLPESTSFYIKNDMAAATNTPLATLLQQLAEDANRRQKLKDFADIRRANDPGYYVRLACVDGNLIEGMRGLEELRFAQLLMPVIWIERPVQDDDTIEFTSRDCDWIIDNSDTLEVFEGKLLRLGQFLQGP